MLKQLEHDNIYLDPQSNIIFTPDMNGVFYPRYKDFNPKTGTVTVLSKVPVYRELFEFVAYERKLIDKRTGKSKPIPLFPYQWSVIITVIDSLLHPKSQEYLGGLSRQSGKSTLLEILVPFVLTVLPKYVDVPTERMSTILGSYKDTTIQELYKKIKPHIISAIEFYNKKNRDILVCKELNPTLTKLKNSNEIMEIDKVFVNGQQIPYSQIRNVSAGTTNDGYYANFFAVDEAGLISNDLFQTSMANFTSATAGVSLYLGVPNHESSSLFYAKRKNKVTNKFIYDFPLVYQGKRMVSEALGELYKTDYLQKVNSNAGGVNSSFIQWNYYLNTEDSNGKFTSRELLETNNILCNTVSTPVPTTDKGTFIVGGIDVSAVGDYKVFTLGTTKITEEFDFTTKSKMTMFNNDVCDIFAFNKNGKTQSGEEFAKMSAELCVKYHVDIVCIDASGAGGVMFTQLFRKYLKMFNAKVMVLPFAYNQNKQHLFSNLENSLYSGRLHLLKEDESWESAKLVEEMIYLKKEHKQGSTYISYRAPNGSGFTDDHVNSLALFNIAVQELIARSKDKRKRIVSDGVDRWRLRLSKYSQGESLVQHQPTQKFVTTLWDIPL